jgi:hypothetical protein
MTKYKHIEKKQSNLSLSLSFYLKNLFFYFNIIINHNHPKSIQTKLWNVNSQIKLLFKTQNQKEKQWLLMGFL